MIKGSGIFMKFKSHEAQIVDDFPTDQLILASGSELGQKELERLMEQLKNDKRIAEAMFGGLFEIDYIMEPVVIMKQEEYDNLIKG